MKQPRAPSYLFNPAKRRIDWLHDRYAGPGCPSPEEFVRRVNHAYYTHSAGLYQERFVDDIKEQYQALCLALDFGRRRDTTVVNIGGGTGFEYEQLKTNGATWGKYYFLEPDEHMAALFTERFGKSDPTLRVLGSGLEEIRTEIAGTRGKIFLINSCLHHVVWIESFLDLLKGCMAPGDILVLGHEPNNPYLNSLWWLLNYAWRSLTSDVLLKRLGIWRSANSKVDRLRWRAINEDLVGNGFSSSHMPPIVIRRIIDYWVGTKGDWKAMGVPQEYDEGFWSPRDIQKYLGPEFETIYESTYRHLGDPGKRGTTSWMNRVICRSTPRGGSVFFLACRKKDTGSVPGPGGGT